MTSEPEWRDANPETENLPVKGRDVITFIAGGIALGILTFVGMRIRPLGLGIGGVAFFYGITMMVRKRKLNYKPALFLIICGFLMLLAYNQFGPVTGFAVLFLVIGAVGLVVFGLIKAIKLAWDVGKFN